MVDGARKSFVGASAGPVTRIARHPLVTCLMPTCDRRPFVPLAVELFLRQDYDHRELLVLDDGADPVGDLLPADDPRVRYERLATPLSLGAKRNLGCELASGDVVVHWDDDDWSAPWRLSYQLLELERRAADMCGLRDVLFFELGSGAAWRYVYPTSWSRPWVAGGTLCYWRSYWQRHPFADVSVGEDTGFVWTGRPRVQALERVDWYVATVHAGNTSPRRQQGSWWRRVPAGVLPVDAVRDLTRVASSPRPPPPVAASMGDVHGPPSRPAPRRSGTGATRSLLQVGVRERSFAEGARARKGAVAVRAGRQPNVAPPTPTAGPRVTVAIPFIRVP